MRTALLTDAGATLRRITELLPVVEQALAKAEAAGPGADHVRETTHVAALTRQIAREAQGLQTYVAAAASVR